MRIPPIGFMAGAAAAQHLLAGKRWPSVRSVVVAAPVVAASGWLITGSLFEFWRHHTSANPYLNDTERTLVDVGPNRATRNPMYLGMTGLLVAHAISRRSWAGLLPAFGFAYAMDRYQIPVEESALAEHLGEQYEAYQQRVPRWFDRRSCNLLCT